MVKVVKVLKMFKVLKTFKVLLSADGDFTCMPMAAGIVGRNKVSIIINLMMNISIR